jgi:predicted N-formylglutamate amidohydrolase
MRIILTCEHYSAWIPERWRGAFAGKEEILQSHRGWDIGAPEIVKSVRPLACATFLGKWSRLLIDLNRSELHVNCFSEFTKGLTLGERRELVESVHRPFRRDVAEAIRGIIDQGERVVHLSVHTFTPVLKGQQRNADVGLLYDPARAGEKEFVRRWQLAFPGELRVRRNYPYRGIADGHTTALRRVFPNENYIGVELEVNQAISQQTQMAKQIRDSFGITVTESA